MNLFQVKPFSFNKREKTMLKLLWQKPQQLFLGVLLFSRPIHAATGTTKKYVNSRANTDLSLKGISEKTLDFLQSFWFGENVGYLLIFSFGCVLTGVILLFARNPQQKKRGVWILIGCAAIGAVWGITYKISGITLQG